MIISFSVYNLKAIRVYNYQVQQKDHSIITEFVLSNTLFTKERITSPITLKNQTCFFDFKEDCLCLFIYEKNDKTMNSIDELSFSLLIQQIEQLLPISELSIKRNFKLFNLIVIESIHSGSISSIDIQHLLKFHQPIKVPLKREVIDLKYPIEMKVFNDSIEFGLKKRNIIKTESNYELKTLDDEDFQNKTNPSFQILDKYNSFPKQYQFISNKTITMNRYEEINVHFKSNGEIIRSELKGNISCSSFTNEIDILQFSLESYSHYSHWCVNKRFVDKGKGNIITWNHPFGTIPLLSFSNEIKTYPILIKAKSSVKSSSILHLELYYTLIGKTFFKSFCCHLPKSIQKIETFNYNHKIMGNTLYIDINQNNDSGTSIKGKICIDVMYQSGKKPYLTDISIGWINCENSFSVSGFPFPVIIGNKQIEINKTSISQSGTYSISFIDNYF